MSCFFSFSTYGFLAIPFPTYLVLFCSSITRTAKIKLRIFVNIMKKISRFDSFFGGVLLWKSPEGFSHEKFH
jgi:hypothetical protein